MTADTARDPVFMRRALRLAALSAGRTAPNPGVGCVLVQAGVVIGEGRHQRCGGAHAEVAALADCRRRGNDPTAATAYVTLAPCTRHGRTPPCVEALIAARVARVVAALADPVQDEAGPRLAAAGIDYAVGLGGALAAHLHGGFLSRVGRGRPRVTGKWAMTLDGCLATARGRSDGISSLPARAASRRRRRAFDAILVGAGTVHFDDPSLLAVPDHGCTPRRIVLSGFPRLRDWTGRRLLADRDRAETWLVHDPRLDPSVVGSLTDLGLRLLPGEPHNPPAVCRLLAAEGINDLLVEGGAVVHGAWLRADCYDRLELDLGTTTLGGGLPVAIGPGADEIGAGRRWWPEEPPRHHGGTVHLRLARRDG